MKPNFFKHHLIFHISGKCTEIRWPNDDMPALWEFFTDHIANLNRQNFLTPYAFVLMDNHFHLLCAVEDQCLDGITDYFHEALQFLNLEELFHKKVEAFSELLYCYKYIYQNPIKSGQAIKAENYPYSTLRAQLTGQNTCGCQDPCNLIYNTQSVLDWLNDKRERLYFATH